MLILSCAYVLLLSAQLPGTFPVKAHSFTSLRTSYRYTSPLGRLFLFFLCKLLQIYIPILIKPKRKLRQDTMRRKVEYGLRAKHKIVDPLRKMIQSPYTHYEAYSSCRKECESIALTAEHIKTQKSEYKIQCKEAERILLEQRFTDVIELLSYYIQAIQILKEGKAEDTIEHILSTLADCAYIYQPRKQFCIMQCIFMLDVSIMEKQIGKILSTLRKQEVYLWTRTPFQMQWLKLLQSYVDFTYAQTDKLTSDSATKETMIQVLVTELMLSNHSTHKIYDSQLIQALLYRLVSLMNVSDPNKTLQKALIYQCFLQC